MKSTESNISYITGGDPVSTWIYMTQVDLLVIGPSSFSLSAAAARSTKPSFSIEQRPKDGRYDDNTLLCSIALDSMQACQMTRMLERYTMRLVTGATSANTYIMVSGYLISASAQ